MLMCLAHPHVPILRNAAQLTMHVFYHYLAFL